ncbi:hypothetical protein K438DRAFT_1751197 [Mycena galopus ATCC 62051]|nr:hypothetical protein K438DRAFT_1751197 [Mycena galopus ATCC 62051]
MMSKLAVLSVFVSLAGSVVGAPVDASMMALRRREIPADVQAALASALQALQAQAATQVASAIAAGQTDFTISESSATTITEGATQTDVTAASVTSAGAVSSVAVSSVAVTPASITAAATAVSAIAETVTSRPPVAPPAKRDFSDDVQAALEAIQALEPDLTANIAPSSIPINTPVDPAAQTDIPTTTIFGTELRRAVVTPLPQKRDIPADVQAALASELQALQAQAATQVASAIAAGETDFTISESSATTISEAATQTAATVASVTAVAVSSAAVSPATITDGASATAPAVTADTVTSRPPVAPPAKRELEIDLQGAISALTTLQDDLITDAE